jgi:glucose-6-phosphate 1-dehydrogenase
MHSLEQQGPALDTAIIIVGASGDLAQRKLVPALQQLYRNKDMPSVSTVIGTGRSDFSHEAFRDRFDVDEEFASRLYYHQGIAGLRRYVDSHGSFSHVVIFLAIPPRAYAQTAQQLAAEEFGPHTSLVIEKPFGHDYASARELNTHLTRYFDESRIYRIDHYLAKEAVQNILVFRFANAIFEPVWNSKYIESIQINASEDIGIGSRAQYFDSSGIIRDMVQNHLTQLLCLITMEPPASLDAEDIRMEKLDILKNLQVESCVRWQYDGYHDEKGVADNSSTETYAEIKARISNFRWYGTPVYIRTGKALARRGTEIGIRFKSVPDILYNRYNHIDRNTIVFMIQPIAGIHVDLAGKKPGSEHTIMRTGMRFCYRDIFKGAIPEAYQRLLCDVIRKDRTLFVSAEETERAWHVYEPILDTGDNKTYPRGTIPPSCFGLDWIDFERYVTGCHNKNPEKDRAEG